MSLPQITPPSFLGSPYNPANAMKTPADLGIKVGDSMDDVVNAVKGVGFYTDQIGFGNSSNGLTSGMPLKPLGVNYFIDTGLKCSNGATMWEYINGIPKGDALGKGAQEAMAAMGLPGLQGLAPGMLEDLKNAMDTKPLMDAMFGSGYPQCKQVTLLVGDSYGNIADSTGESWITNPETATKNGDNYVQTRWVQDTNLSGASILLNKEDYDATPKTYNEDGTPITKSKSKSKSKSTFISSILQPSQKLIIILILCSIAFGIIYKKRK